MPAHREPSPEELQRLESALANMINPIRLSLALGQVRPQAGPVEFAALVVTTSELAGILGVAPRHLQRLAAAGELVSHGPNAWRLASGVQQYLTIARHRAAAKAAKAAKSGRKESTP